MTSSANNSTELNTTTFQDVTCAGCACLCDDLKVTVTDNRVVQIEPACELAKIHFNCDHHFETSCLINGHHATVEEGIAHAAKLIEQSNALLMCGLGETTTETQRAIADLADVAGAYLDGTNPAFADPTGVVSQTTGYITASLGEIRHRADAILFWGTDPAITHPRHFERYSIDAPGKFLDPSKPRTVLAIDSETTATSKRAQQFVKLSPENNLIVLQTLLALARDNKIDAAAVESQTGVSLETIQSIHTQMSQANYAAFIIGKRFTGNANGQACFELLADYVRELNRTNRAIISLNRAGPNWVGAANVIAWRTGYPRGVNLAAGYPQYDPENNTTAALLQQKRVDAALYFTGDWTHGLCTAAREHLHTVPQIVLSNHQTKTVPKNGVLFQVARPGVETTGTMYRMDEVSLPLKQVRTTELPDAGAIIQALYKLAKDTN
ncbi:MAG: hypothetical protein COA78_15915 [Blastopirellula sp.]|nr:MAG: hypothetical protein COA78_15915 [Blastopirellula sp.]